MAAQQKEQLIFQILIHHVSHVPSPQHLTRSTHAESSSRREWSQRPSLQRCKCCGSAKQHQMPGLSNVPGKETFITQSPAVFWGQTCNWKTTTNVQAPPSYQDLNLDATACFIRSKSLENRLGRKITLENKLHFVLCFCYSKSTRILGIETMISSYLSNRISTEKISTRWPLLWCLYLGGH